MKSATPETRHDEMDHLWTKDPSEYPAFRSLSPAFYFRRVLVHSEPTAQLEFVSVRMPDPKTAWQAHSETFMAMSHWNLQWEAGPYRCMLGDDFPDALKFLNKLQSTSSAPTSDIVLVPDTHDVYGPWEPLYHLLPRRLLLKHGLPVIGRGVWPMRGAGWDAQHFAPRHQPALARAFAEHLWQHGFGARPGSRLSAYSSQDSLVLLSHDLSFWRAHLEKVIRRRASDVGRVARSAGDTDPDRVVSGDGRVYELPRFGCELWTGEEEAADVTCDLIELADERGRLRAIIDAIQSNRVEDDFSPRWSREREDFERKLYHKRSKVRVSFVELNDSIPFYDDNAELHGNLLCRDLMSLVDPKDRRIVVCLHQGVTHVGDIANTLGYANHSPISKALDRIRRKAKRLLNL